MKRNLKRLPALLLAILLCLSLLPATAWAVDYMVSGEGWGIGQNVGESPTLYIESDAGMKNWIESNNGYMYVGIIYAVNLAEGITEIPYHAFYKCNQLTTVEIPASVTELGKNDVFEGCTALTSITVADGNDKFFVEDGVLYRYAKDDDGNKIDDEFIALICPPGKSGEVTLKDGTVEIGGSAFEGCTKLTGVTLNEGLTRIGSNAFGGCSSLQDVTLPATLTSLGNGVFNGCVGLTSLAVADGNADYSAEDGVLYDKGQTELLLYPAAKSDADFTVPDSVTHIASYAFQGARHLKTVTAGNLTSIESSAFTNCEALTSFTAASLSEVEFQAFYGCSNLETFTLTDADSLTTIGGSAFNRCSSLTAAPIAGATSIEEGAFQDCTALTSLSFCETGNVSIGKNAFSGCTGLTELTFPASVTSIGYSAFGGCNQVTVITFKGETPPTCDSNSFSIGDPNNFQIVVPSGSESSYQTALGETLGSYVGNTLVKKYPLFVNGQQLTSTNTTINCGSGTASFDVATSTLTLTNATIENMGGNYGYGGAINSGLAELTIKLVGTNTINAEQEQWGTTYQDSINSGANCDVKIVSGESDGTMPTLVCDLIDMGRGGSGFTGGAGEGNLTVDGVNLTVNDRIFVHHNTTFQNGAQVNVTGGLTVNNSATVKVKGETTAVTVKYIALGNDLPGQTNRLVLDSGVLTITGSVAYPGAPDGDTNPYAIRFDPVSSGSIAINGGMFVKQASCAGTNIDESEITQADNLPVQGSWDSGTLIIGPANDGKYLVTVKSDPTDGGVAYGGGRYDEDEEVTLTATAQTGWFFIGWYQDSGDAAVSTSKSYEYTVGETDVIFTARFIEDKLYQAEQAKDAFDGAQKKDSLTWDILTDAVDAYEAVAAYLEQVKAIGGLLTDEEKAALDNRYTALTDYYNDIKALDLSGQDLGSADLAELDFFTGLTDLDLSGTALTDLSGLSGLTTLKNLNLSNNKGISDLTALKGLTTLKTLDISGTGVTTLDSLVLEDGSSFPGSETLTAKNLSLTSISALVNLVSADGFSAETVTKWDFTGSNLPPNDENRADVATIEAALDNKFFPPTIPENTYIISASPATLNFGSVSPNYTQPAPQTVTIKNTGNQTVTLAQPASEHYDLSSISPTELAPNSTATFTVQPKPNLGVGTYNETLTVTGSNGDDHTAQATVALRFEVTQPTSGGSGGATTYAVTVEKAEHGKVTASPSRASSGTPVTITVTPDEGYELEKLTVTDSKGSEVKLTDKGNSKYTFDMPNTKVEIRAVFRKIAPVWENCPGGVDCPAYSYRDVDTSAWYHEAVDYVLVNGLMSGYGNGVFGPNDHLSRAQLCQILYNKEGRPAVTGSSVFIDITDGAWYSGAVTWAAENGIVDGYGNGLFGPEDNITREQLAAILYRYARAKGYDVSVGEDTNILSYTDALEISEYAIPAMQWACGAGIIQGNGGYLNPQGDATRAEIATMLMRFCGYYANTK